MSEERPMTLDEAVVQAEVIDNTLRPMLRAFGRLGDYVRSIRSLQPEAETLIQRIAALRAEAASTAAEAEAARTKARQDIDTALATAKASAWEAELAGREERQRLAQDLEKARDGSAREIQRLAKSVADQQRDHGEAMARIAEERATATAELEAVRHEAEVARETLAEARAHLARIAQAVESPA